jgi:hypothetical protein
MLKIEISGRGPRLLSAADLFPDALAPTTLSDKEIRTLGAEVEVREEPGYKGISTRQRTPIRLVPAFVLVKRNNVVFGTDRQDAASSALSPNTGS